MSSGFFECNAVRFGFVPVNMATAANNGSWAHVGNFHRVACILIKGAGTAGDDPAMSFQQATSSSGSNAKDLNIEYVWERLGTTANSYTLRTIDDSASYTNTASAEVVGIIGTDIQTNWLDLTNGFSYIRGRVADVGSNAQIGGMIYIGYQPRFGGTAGALTF